MINVPTYAECADGTPPVIVLGGGINGLSAVRSLAQAGLRSVVVVDTKRDVAAISRYSEQIAVATFNGEAFVKDLLELRKKLPQDGILICVDDRPALTLSLYRKDLSPSFRFQLPSHEMLVDLAFKDSFFHIAQRSGYPVPRTRLLRNHDELSALRDFRLPICVKPNGRSRAYDGSFKKAYRVETRAEAQALCERVLDTVGEVLVQEWIEGTNDAIYFCLCYMGRPEPVAFTGRKGRSWPPQTGVTASCWAAPEEAPQLEELTIGFFRSVGVTSGFASMEYKRDQRDGRFLMVEPTVGRTDGQVEISALCGINLCHVAYCDAAGLPRPSLALDPAHVWRDEVLDFRSAQVLGTRCAYPLGYRIHNAYWRYDDPAPALLRTVQYVKSAMRQRLKDDRRPAEQ
jgi:predicted ATP-grasp superfamily ATP-dependent carboligase